MFLTKDQEEMLSGMKGETIAKSMELVVKIGEVYNADQLIPITNAQVAGVSYLTVGESIFSFFEQLSKDAVTVKVPTWLNPAGMDMEKWREMEISEDFAEKQFRIVKFYEGLGIKPTLTCAPYLIGHTPSYGAHLAWSESSAVSMANSFYGARTNREGAPSSLASAITGLTANYGLHLTENRNPRILVDVRANLENFSDYSALGYWYGKKFQGLTPYFVNIQSLKIDEAKMLAAALAASGSVALYHVKDLTPESQSIDIENVEEKIEFTETNKKEIYNLFNQINEGADLVAIGCPHASYEDIKVISNTLQSRQMKKNIEFWIFTSSQIKTVISANLLLTDLESRGIKVYTDTCMVVSPSVGENFRNIITNSTKAAHYLSRAKTTMVNLLPLDLIMKEVTV
ncbi:MAG: aconitase X catalytic domain-containing protein [Candidatus Heimdallarchaeota archaeon]|nr:aconitase X catalytic domain-containing protein [Candidatus Heimdallarchaeota archaeon]